MRITVLTLCSAVALAVTPSASFADHTCVGATGLVSTAPPLPICSKFPGHSCSEFKVDIYEVVTICHDLPVQLP